MIRRARLILLFDEGTSRAAIMPRAKYVGNAVVR